MSDNYILDYWEWIDTLDPDVQEVVRTCWDETGRPTEEHMVPVRMLLDLSDDFDTFLKMYLQMMHPEEAMFEVERQKAQVYYHCYISGMRRLERAITDMHKA